MEQVAQIKEILKNTGKNCNNTQEQYSLIKLLEMQCNSINSEHDLLHDDYDCKICSNRGYTAFIKDNYILHVQCECMKIRKNLKLIKQSGLGSLLDRYTFDTFNPSEAWQQRIKQKAKEFLSDCLGKWFYIGGQVGCGKTHICTAITGEFIKRGIFSKYMLWVDESTKLKALKMHEEDYSKAITKIKNTPVLYIDDFLKVPYGKEIGAADISLAFEILNFRYNNDKLVTIISSEKPISEILRLDEALGSRISQRAKDYNFKISDDINKNYRLKM